jgi:hypothetical protein
MVYKHPPPKKKKEKKEKKKQRVRQDHQICLSIFHGIFIAESVWNHKDYNKGRIYFQC